MPIRTERTVIVVEWTCAQCGRLFEHEGPCIAHERAHAIRRDAGTTTTAQQQSSTPCVDLEEMAEISEIARDQIKSKPAVIALKDPKTVQITSTSDNFAKRKSAPNRSYKVSIGETGVESAILTPSKTSTGFKSSGRSQARRFTYNGREYK